MNYHVLENTIVLNYDGKTELISRGDPRFEKALDAIKNEQLGGLRAIVTSVVDYLTSSGLVVEDGLVKIDGEVLPTELNDRILAFQKEGLPFKHLVKFWNNLKNNPSFNSRQMLFKFLEHNGHPITKDGCFIAYRGVSEDFKDMHTGKFDNSPKSICSVSRDQVDDNPNNTCSYGLHVACYDYAKGFGRKMIEVKVNPLDVVCVPTDYNGTKMRVSKFEVVRECERMLEEQLYSYKFSYQDEDGNEFEPEELNDEELDVGNAPEWNETEDYNDESYDECSCEHCTCDCEEEKEEVATVDQALAQIAKADDLNSYGVRFEKKVDSSVIARIEYRGTSLTVELKNGKRYRYLKVPANTAMDFLQSPSKGSFYNTEIKGEYTTKKIA